MFVTFSFESSTASWLYGSNVVTEKNYLHGSPLLLVGLVAWSLLGFPRQRMKVSQWLVARSGLWSGVRVCVGYVGLPRWPLALTDWPHLENNFLISPQNLLLRNPLLKWWTDTFGWWLMVVLRVPAYRWEMRYAKYCWCSLSISDVLSQPAGLQGGHIYCIRSDR